MLSSGQNASAAMSSNVTSFGEGDAKLASFDSPFCVIPKDQYQMPRTMVSIIGPSDAQDRENTSVDDRLWSWDEKQWRGLRQLEPRSGSELELQSLVGPRWDFQLFVRMSFNVYYFFCFEVCSGLNDCYLL